MASSLSSRKERTLDERRRRRRRRHGCPPLSWLCMALLVKASLTIALQRRPTRIASSLPLKFYSENLSTTIFLRVLPHEYRLSYEFAKIHRSPEEEEKERRSKDIFWTKYPNEIFGVGMRSEEGRSRKRGGTTRLQEAEAGQGQNVAEPSRIIFSASYYCAKHK
uniref:Uncharacterized protein n=1 Tax=Vespula pensylvanica TaxID=30213 RepID=A0A834KWP1_VESPE|nr:hypothetical protein H0235_013157 [Vespula pensylvanica]